MNDAAKPRLQVLDLLRIFAACSVMFFHLGYWSWANPRSVGAMITEGHARFPQLGPYTWWGWVGVDIFFVISGFVISYTAANGSFGRFVRSRFLRLFPSILVCATITLAIFLSTGIMRFDRAIEAYWKTVAIWPLGGWLDGVYWTLATELTFYVIVALVLLTGRPQWLAVVMAVIGLATTAAAVFFYLTSGVAPAVPGISKELGDSLLLRHGMYFALGYFIWSAVTSGWTPPKTLLIGVFLIGGIFPILAGADLLAPLRQSGPSWVPVLIWLGAIIGMMIALGGKNAKNPGPELRWLTLLGKATFPLYLVHYVAGATLMGFLIRSGWEPIVAMPASAAAMVVSAIVLTVLIEAGPRRWIAAVIDAVFRRKRVAAAVG
jgi:peptidoglycan/LPS O-acetylase OafA/YrhL